MQLYFVGITWKKYQLIWTKYSNLLVSKKTETTYFKLRTLHSALSFYVYNSYIILIIDKRLKTNQYC